MIDDWNRITEQRINRLHTLCKPFITLCRDNISHFNLQFFWKLTKKKFRKKNLVPKIFPLAKTCQSESESEKWNAITLTFLWQYCRLSFVKSYHSKNWRYCHYNGSSNIVEPDQFYTKNGLRVYNANTQIFFSKVIRVKRYCHYNGSSNIVEPDQFYTKHGIFCGRNVYNANTQIFLKSYQSKKIMSLQW